MGDVRRLLKHNDRPPERPVFLTSAIDWLFARGHAVDIVLLVMLVELVALTIRRGWPFTTALLRLLPGAMMMLALRAALVGADWRWIALALAASFPVHLADLRRRG